MHPYVFGVLSWYVAWAGAVLVGTVANLVVLVRMRIRVLPALTVLVACAVVGVLGAKAEFYVENLVQAGVAPMSEGYRLPGGLLAVGLSLPILARAVGVSPLRLLDALSPGTALAFGLGRIGCFLNGCCAGVPTSVPWALVFPTSSRVYTNQLTAGVLPLGASASLPVHPLQLYFLTVGVLIAGVLYLRLPVKRYDGEVVLWLLVLQCGAKFLLEGLRAREYGGAPNAAWVLDGVLAAAGLCLLVLPVPTAGAAGASGGRPRRAHRNSP